jgi:hypothetical protein
VRFKELALVEQGKTVEVGCARHGAETGDGLRGGWPP